MGVPIRIQLSRKKGWRMPENTVHVGRPTRWGNPYDVRRYGLDLSLAMFRNTAQGIWDCKLIPANAHQLSWIEWMYEDHQKWCKRIGQHPIEAMWQDLTGKNLACWCALDKPCHADILIELANTHPPSD